MGRLPSFHTEHSLTPATKRQPPYEMVLPRDTERKTVLKFIQGSVPKVLTGRWSPSASHIPDFQTPRRKADIQHKPYHLYRRSSHLGKTAALLPKSKFPDVNQGPSLQAGPSQQQPHACHVNPFLRTLRSGSYVSNVSTAFCYIRCQLLNHMLLHSPLTLHTTFHSIPY